jgi:hypothetical protein
MSNKAFTVAEANALLPILEVALERITDAAEQARERHDKLQVLDALWSEAVLEPGNPDHGEWLAHRAALAEAVDTMESAIRQEITGRGIRFPWGGLQHGLLDFPTTWEGRWVYLCWQRGEPRLLAWHEIADGYAGRQAITPEHERRMGQEDDPDSLDDPHALDDGLPDF